MSPNFETPADVRSEFAYQLSLRALDQQERVLTELRSRTGILFAGSSIVASFLGSRAAADKGIGWLSGAALIAFALSLAPTVYILLPKGAFIFALRGSALLEDSEIEGLDRSALSERLTYWIEAYRDDNQGRVDRLFSLYRAATTAVVVEIVLWGAQVLSV